MEKQEKIINYNKRFKGAFETIISLASKEGVRGGQLKAIVRIAKAQLKNLDDKPKAEL